MFRQQFRVKNLDQVGQYDFGAGNADLPIFIAPTGAEAGVVVPNIAILYGGKVGVAALFGQQFRHCRRAAPAVDPEIRRLGNVVDFFKGQL